MASLAAVLFLLAGVLGGCYAIPAPPPSPTGAIPPLPPHAMSGCRWTYGQAWAGWGWYSVC
jgi:hypothetical protein